MCASPVFALTAQENALGGVKATAENAGLQEGDPATTIGFFIGVILSVLGLLLFIITVYGGIQMMTAAGKADQYEKGKKMIIEGVMGMLICLASWSLSTFVVNSLQTAVGSELPAAEVPPQAP